MQQNTKIERGVDVSTTDDLIKKALSRRSFIVGAGSAATLAAVGCQNHFQPQTTPPTPTPALTDVDYLNFALNLEYLEANYYLIAATGSGLSSADGGGTVNGGSKVAFSSAIQQEYAYEIAQNELNHVRFLRSALGSSAVSAPVINLGTSFDALAQASGIGKTFNPYADFGSFLLGAFVFEDVGVTAYGGAAPLLTNTAYLAAAVGIQQVEAYHAGEIRTLLVQANKVGPANEISALRASLGGGNETPLSATTIVPADQTTGVGFARTTAQVLQIVYATADGNASSGGFFPAGLNGNINITPA
jgi:hypothetical protein